MESRASLILGIVGVSALVLGGGAAAWFFVGPGTGGPAVAGPSPSATDPPHPPPTTPGASTARQIAEDWAAFFSSGTPMSTRVDLLQGGQGYRPAISLLAGSPFGRSMGAQVLRVTATGPSSADVTYRLLHDGRPVETVTGTAVDEDGTWQVSSGTFCQLQIQAGARFQGCAYPAPSTR